MMPMRFVHQKIIIRRRGKNKAVLNIIFGGQGLTLPTSNSLNVCISSVCRQNSIQPLPQQVKGYRITCIFILDNCFKKFSHHR